MYAQVITPGYRIVLKVDGKIYQYHADTQRNVVYCESKEAQPLPGGESTENVRLAREDLARRLGVSEDSVTVAVVIGRNSDGCVQLPDIERADRQGRTPTSSDRPEYIAETRRGDDTNTMPAARNGHLLPALP